MDPLLSRAAAALTLLASTALQAGEAAPAQPRFISGYLAQNSSDRLNEIIRKPPPAWQSSYLAALTWGRAIGGGETIRWEVEGQLVRHWGMQRNLETNVVLIARWMRFPWDHIVDTRFAFGEGLSYASRLPHVEPRAGREDERTVRLLNYLLVEWEFMLPANEASQWSVFTRIHHRSGVAGIFGNVKGGSNFVGLGLRYTY
jgi:hypothetical protein